LSHDETDIAFVDRPQFDLQYTVSLFAAKRSLPWRRSKLLNWAFPLPGTVFTNSCNQVRDVNRVQRTACTVESTSSKSSVLAGLGIEGN